MTSTPDRTLYVVSWQNESPTLLGQQYGPSFVTSFDLDTGDLVATSDLVGHFNGGYITSVAYDYQGSLWGVGPEADILGPPYYFTLVQFDPVSLDVLATYQLLSPTLGGFTQKPSGITFSADRDFVWCPFDADFEGVVSFAGTPGFDGAAIFAAPRSNGSYGGRPWWVSTPLEGSTPYVFTLGVQGGACVLLRQKVCPNTPGTTYYPQSTWEVAANFGAESFGPGPISINGELACAYWWDFSGPVVTSAGIYVYDGQSRALNLYDLKTYGLLNYFGYGSGLPLVMSFAVDSINNVAYLVGVAVSAGSGTGTSTIYKLDMNTNVVTTFASIDVLYPIELDSHTFEWSLPTFSSGPTCHIPLPSAPSASCGNPWLRMFQRSDGYGVRMNQTAGSANSPLSVRNQSAGNSYT